MTSTTTAMEQTLLGMLKADQRVWGLTEMREAMLEQREPSDGAPTSAKVRAGVQALVAEGLALRVSYELVTISRRGILAKTADPGAAALASGGTAGGVGVFSAGADDEALLVGGAEGLAGLTPVVPRGA